MKIEEMQKIVDKWIKENTKGYWKPHNIMLRLVEEIGELSREINHQFGEKNRKLSEGKKEINDEISDVLYTLICLANSLNINLGKSFENTMNKYERRDKNRHK